VSAAHRAFFVCPGDSTAAPVVISKKLPIIAHQVAQGVETDRAQAVRRAYLEMIVAAVRASETLALMWVGVERSGVAERNLKAEARITPGREEGRGARRKSSDNRRTDPHCHAFISYP
jgi:hypothetical protein